MVTDEPLIIFPGNLGPDFHDAILSLANPR